MARVRRSLVGWPLLTLLLVLAPDLPGGAETSEEFARVPEPSAGADWDSVERLLDEQRLAAAAERLDELLAAARERGDDDGLSRALVRRAQVTIALGGYETAVEALRAEPWPEEPLARAAVELYDAFALGTYLDRYGWEIARRERVISGGPLDLELWTGAQIAAEVNRAFARVWAHRDRLGAVPATQFETLRPNDFPAGIRPTLRDAVSYLWADQLARSSHWTPDELEELWKLDLDALAGGVPVEPTTQRLTDAGLHPLTRLAAVLGDLERWHRQRREAGAALEARLERLGRLFDAFHADEDRQRVRAALAASLSEFRDDPWWAMGMARLASFWRRSDQPDALVRAREIAIEGEAAFPGSPGALTCRRQREEIEAPSFELEAMTVDAPGRRSLAVRHRNLERLHFRAYRLPAERFAGKPVVWHGWSDQRIRPLLAGRPAAEWSVDLPASTDRRDHRTYVTPPVAENGRYLVVASAAPGFSRRGNRLQAVELALSDLVLLTEIAEDGRLVLRALSGATGTPLSGTEATLYAFEWERLPQPVDRGATDAAGLVELVPPLAERRRGGGLAVVVRHGDDEQIWRPGDWPRRSPRTDGELAVDALVFTDRAIYRPGQTLHWKTLAFERPTDGGEPRPASSRSLAVRLVDPNGELVGERTASTNEFGTASGKFEIPTGRLLGDWRLEVGDSASASVAVEEYKRPTFEVTLLPPAGEPRLNRPVELTGEARYYFGLPVAAGRVAWRVVREPIRLLESALFRRWEPPPSRTIASGTSSLDADGRFSLRFTAEADERAIDDCGCFRYRVEAEVTDGGGETRSGATALSLGRVAVGLHLGEAPPLLVAGEIARLALRREDLDGAPRAGDSSWRLVELVQPARVPLPADLPEPIDPSRESFATPGDRLRPRWAEVASSAEVVAGWRAGRQVGSGTLRHGEDGRATLALPALAAGVYRLHAETRDRHGEMARFEHALLVVPPAADGSRLALPLELRFAEASVAVGATARLFVHSGIPGQTIAVEIVRRERPVERHLLVAGRDTSWLELPVGPADRGGIGVRATLVADHQVVTRRTSVAVPWSDKELTLELASFRDRLEPGAREAIRVTVRDSDGHPLAAGAAELVASMYDRSLDLFRPFTTPQPHQIWPHRDWPTPIRHTLGGRGPVWGAERDWHRWSEPPTFSVDAFVAVDPYGIGGPGGGGPQPMRMRGEVMEAMSASPRVDAGEQQLVRVTAETPLIVEPPPPAALRTDFAETAFWRPHLVTDELGGVGIEFRVPDSLTSWKLWISAWTRELASGYLERELVSAKQLMVRPYLPRFLREGDRAELRVAIQNGGERPFAGEVRFAVVDPESGDDLSAELGLPSGGATAAFTALAGRGANLSFPVVAPRGVRPLAVRVEARAGAVSDGELRPLPLLPSRLHLSQSRFATLRDGAPRELVFDDLRNDDPTRIDEQLVVTVDARLLDGVLAALPYLVDYPYECTEQTMNRFYAAAILDALYARHPSIGAAAAQLAARDTRWERWDTADPNRGLTLEETPWLAAARGGTAGEGEALLRLLDPEVARAVRAGALAQLAEAQLPSGAFPWFPGGPPSPFMTLYLLAGFARVAELGGEIPATVVRQGWRYVADQIERDWWRAALDGDCCWELLTFANYIASSSPDPSLMGDVLPIARRRELLDFSFRHWRQHAPQSKLQLALTLQRMGRPGDARRVLAAVMDSAKSDPDLGTYWAPEDRAWLWYNDTIETHAWALRTLSEIAPDDPRREGLVVWLFLNKRLGHWKSTRATAEALHALVVYLAEQGGLDRREEIAVTVGGRTTELVFEPGRLTGHRRRVALHRAEIDPRRDASILVEPRTDGLAFASATWSFSTEKLPTEARGDLFHLERRWFRRLRGETETTLVPLAEGARLAIGDELEIQLSVRARAAAEYVHLRDPRPAGLEPDRAESGWRWDLGIAYYEEIRDSGANFFFEALPAGDYTLRHRLRANVAGTFRAAPAELQSIYAPEFVAYSAGGEVSIAP